MRRDTQCAGLVLCPVISTFVHSCIASLSTEYIVDNGALPIMRRVSKAPNLTIVLERANFF